MSQLFNIFFIFFIFFIFNDKSYALTQQQFIKHLIKDQRFFKEQSADLEVLKSDLEVNRLKYGEWQSNLNAKLGYTERREDRDTYDYTHIVDDTVKEVSLSSNKRFFSNGSRLNLSLKKSWPIEKDLDSEGNAEEDVHHATSLRLGWNIPLLRNLGGINDQQSYDLSNLSNKQVQYSLFNKKEDFIVKNLYLFLDWIYFNQRKEILISQLKAMKNAFKKNVESDFYQADIKALTRFIKKLNRQLFKTRSSLDQKAIVINKFLKSDKTLSTALSKPEIDWDWNLEYNFIATADLREYIKKFVMDVKILELGKKSNERLIKTQENQLLPTLGLSVSSYLENKKGDYLSYSSSKLRDYEVALKFSMPIGSDDYKEEKLAKYLSNRQKIEHNFQRQLNDTISDVSQSTIDIKARKHSIKSHKIDVITQKEFLISGLDHYLAGKGDVYKFVTDQEHYQQLVLDYIQEFIDYHKKIIAHKRLLNQLFNEYRH
jgi:hypothetical protein